MSKSLTVSKKSLGDNPWTSSKWVINGNSLSVLQKWKALKQKTYTADSLEIADCNYQIGLVLMVYGKQDQALNYFNSALKVYKKKLSEYDSLIANTYYYIGLIYLYGKQNSVLADQNLNKALIIYKAKNNSSSNQLQIANTYYHLANLQRLYGKPSNAVDNYNLAQSIYRKLKQTQNLNVQIGNCFYNSGLAQRQLGQHKLEVLFIDESIRIYKQIYSGNNEQIANTYYNLGLAYLLNTQYTNALQNFKLAQAIYKNIKITIEQQRSARYIAIIEQTLKQNGQSNNGEPIKPKPKPKPDNKPDPKPNKPNNDQKPDNKPDPLKNKGDGKDGKKK